jgi:transglutaminase-like putative cysteine protease
MSSRSRSETPESTRTRALAPARKAPTLPRVHFRISHETRYRYDVAVRLAPHRLRLSPRAGDCRLIRQQLSIAPLPTTRSDYTDAAGNVITQLEFGGETRELWIRSELDLHTSMPTALEHLPLRLAPLQVSRSTAFHPEVHAFTLDLASAAAFEPVATLDRLSHALFSRMNRYVRHEGPARPAHETLALGGGACRDLTAVFLEACLVLGLQGRFVSGYQSAAQTPDGRCHLHAWAEVLLPGVGYRGWDPMHGARVLDGHVALCAAETQAATMPVEGGFFFDGPTVNSTLDHDVRIATD